MERRDLETVRYEKDGPVARVILNRPDKANAQSPERRLMARTANAAGHAPTRRKGMWSA
jgi:enoyl-CoA hydratase